MTVTEIKYSQKSFLNGEGGVLLKINLILTNIKHIVNILQKHTLNKIKNRMLQLLKVHNQRYATSFFRGNQKFCVQSEKS